MPLSKDQVPDYFSLIVKAETQNTESTERRYKSGIIMSKYRIEDNGGVPESKYRRDAPLFGGAITADVPKEFFDAR